MSDARRTPAWAKPIATWILLTVRHAAPLLFLLGVLVVFLVELSHVAAAESRFNWLFATDGKDSAQVALGYLGGGLMVWTLTARSYLTRRHDSSDRWPSLLLRTSFATAVFVVIFGLVWAGALANDDLTGGHARWSEATRQLWWECLDAVPLLQLPEALGISEPMPPEGLSSASRLLLLGFRISALFVVGSVIAKTWSYVIQNAEPRPDGTASAPNGEGHDSSRSV